jgi:uncharacterized membrane protein YdjX (TVP38/TMEM64 family)
VDTGRPLRRAILITAVVLAVPIIPFLLLGSTFEDRVAGWFRGEMSTAERFTFLVALLASDLLLPVPSSMVSTYGGGVLGMWPAAAASWLGMMLGATIGFALARLFGKPFAVRRVLADDLDRLQGLTQRFGPAALVLTRALPILAEACVLLMGATGLSWRRFLVPVAAANAVIAVAYSAFGAYFQERNSLLVAVIAAGLIPLAVALLARQRMKTTSQL